MALLMCCIIYYMATNVFVFLVNKEWVLLSLPHHCLHKRCRWKIPFRRNEFADSYKFIEQSGLLKFPNLEILGELSKHKLHFHCASSYTLALVRGWMHHNYHNIILHLFLYKTPSSMCGILSAWSFLPYIPSYDLHYVQPRKHLRLCPSVLPWLYSSTDLSHEI